MNNKMFKRIVATAISVVMLGTCAFATNITVGTYEDDTLNFTYTYDEENVSKVTYLAYAAKSAASDATGTNIVEIAGTKYELCEIIAIDQLEGEAITGSKEVAINSALMNVGTDVAPETAPYIILKSGDDAEGTTASQILITTGAEEEPPVGDTYTVTFIGADGSTAYVTETEVASGTAITDLIPATNPTKDKGTAKLDWGFVGWYSNADCTTALDTTITVTSDLTFYAKFVSNYIVGDINADGKINVNDVNILKQYNLEKLSEANITKFKVNAEIENNYYMFNSKDRIYLNGDVNGDGKINVNDVNILKQYNLEKLSEANITKFGINSVLTVK